LAIFYFGQGRFQCTAKGIFIPKDLKSGEISRKKHFKIFNFLKKLKDWGDIRGVLLLLFEIQYLMKS